MTGSAIEWVEIIVATDDPATVWKRILANLRDLALQSTKSGVLDRATVVPDRLLANSAWNLWEEFLANAPTAIDELKKFWVNATASGTAVLVLDALSLRELPLLVAAAKARGLTPARVEAFGAQVPTETDRFAEALGLFGRSKLFNNQAPAAFIFGGPDVYTDVLDAPFADCVGSVPSTPRVFLWHKWPDEPLIHLHDSKDDGPDIVAAQTKQQLSSDDFWRFVDRVRQGRRLVITSDHGYAVSRFFSDEMKDPDTVQLLRNAFGAKRCALESPATPWPRRNLPPLVIRHNGRLAVLGQRKWAVQGGFPHLCHGGLSLLEAVVPFIEFPAK
ncbi:MAG: hypothetical protein HY661_07370 [Betaproteobacteria bacterium]|nr:hypothetical protein [Betaproteobacteria bacterium]